MDRRRAAGIGGQGARGASGEGEVDRGVEEEDGSDRRPVVGAPVADRRAARAGTCAGAGEPGTTGVVGGAPAVGADADPADQRCAGVAAATPGESEGAGPGDAARMARADANGAA